MPSEMDYADELAIVITEQNQDQLIDLFCDGIFKEENDNGILKEETDDTVTTNEETDVDISDRNDYYRNREALSIILRNFPKPFTIVQEFNHIDRCFRDTYYMYFSNQHFNVTRYSKRLSFFKGEFHIDDFFDNNDQTDKTLQDNFMGSCVINPLIIGAIGRTLINPKYVNFSKETTYMRLTEFKLHIYGKNLSVLAFPYRMQDSETTCCVEVTLLNLLEYYSNAYEDYKSVLPSEIISVEQSHHHERVLPTKGMSYPLLTKVLTVFGFSPRLYNLSSMNSFDFSQINRDTELKRWLHYYTESGIPVAVNLSPIGNTGTGHSVVCIGHGSVNNDLIEAAKKRKWISWQTKDQCHPIINSADFYDQYVIVDDNQPVYQLRNYNDLSAYPDLKISDISAPLYKRMFLDAPDASSIVLSLLQHQQYGIHNWVRNSLNPKEDVVMRLFMASGHNFKNYRTKTINNLIVRKVYATLPMPRFVWVCELYRVDDYRSSNAFGEIVIDATSAYSRGARSVLLMHYSDVLLLRAPENKGMSFDRIFTKCTDLFPGYSHNLYEVPQHSNCKYRSRSHVCTAK